MSRISTKTQQLITAFEKKLLAEIELAKSLKLTTPKNKDKNWINVRLPKELKTHTDELLLDTKYVVGQSFSNNGTWVCVWFDDLTGLGEHFKTTVDDFTTKLVELCKRPTSGTCKIALPPETWRLSCYIADRIEGNLAIRSTLDDKFPGGRVGSFGADHTHIWCSIKSQTS